jgi:hypothetical protein
MIVRMVEGNKCVGLSTGSPAEFLFTQFATEQRIIELV